MNTLPWIITPRELKDCLRATTVVDVRDENEYIEGAIEGSKLIPLSELSDRAPNELDQADEIVVYCSQGIRSLEAIMRLKRKGFENVRTLQGGIEAWQATVH